MKKSTNLIAWNKKLRKNYYKDHNDAGKNTTYY